MSIILFWKLFLFLHGKDHFQDKLLSPAHTHTHTNTQCVLWNYTMCIFCDKNTGYSHVMWGRWWVWIIQCSLHCVECGNPVDWLTCSMYERSGGRFYGQEHWVCGIMNGHCHCTLAKDDPPSQMFNALMTLVSPFYKCHILSYGEEVACRCI